jgi:hypothetical protein
MESMFDSGLSTEGKRAADMTGQWWSLSQRMMTKQNRSSILLYLAKILALYEDVEGNLKALVHLVEYKTARGIEGTFSNSRLVQHYHLESVPSNGKPRVYSVPVDRSSMSPWHMRPP